MSENAPELVAEPSDEPVRYEPTEATRARVRLLAKIKTEKRVAKELGISRADFDRHHLEDYEDGVAEAQELLLGKLLAQGGAGNSNSSLKYMSMRGLVAPKRVEVTGRDGQPIEHVDLSRLSDDQLREYGRLAAIAEGLDPDAITVEVIGGDPPPA